MGQNVNYKEVMTACENISDVVSDVNVIVYILKCCYLTSKNEGNFSASFEQLKGLVESVAANMGIFMSRYTDILVAVADNYQELDKELQSMMGDS